jgi:hypothetical protein
MLLGSARALDDQPSGRAFLQKGSVVLTAVPEVARFFEALASGRRMRLCND